MKPKIALDYLNIGRIVRVQEKNVDWGYGVSINFNERRERGKVNTEEKTYVVDIMVCI